MFVFSPIQLFLTKNAETVQPIPVSSQRFFLPDGAEKLLSFDIEVERFNPISRNLESFRTIPGVPLPYELRLPSDASYYSTLFGVDHLGGRHRLYSLPYTSPNGTKGVFILLLFFLVC